MNSDQILKIFILRSFRLKGSSVSCLIQNMCKELSVLLLNCEEEGITGWELSVEIRGQGSFWVSGIRLL